jgi:hypothetical protein
MSIERPAMVTTMTPDTAGAIITALERERDRQGHRRSAHVLIRRMLTALFAAIPFARRVDGPAGCGHCCSKACPASRRP